MAPPHLRVDWSVALPTLEEIAEHSPDAARRLVESLERMASLGWSLGHPTDRPGIRYWSVPPVGVLYQVRGNRLYVVRAVDPRRLRHPLW